MRDDNLMNGKLTRWLQAALTLLVLIGSLANAQAAGRDEIVFFFNDAQGSAVAAVSEQGDLCWSEQYTPYGDKRINDDLVSVPGCGIIGEERGFTGHTEDVNSDLVYMQQRYNDPSIGRFLSIDPIDSNPLKPQTLNRYAYANNNPYKYVDPDGQLPIAIVGVIAVGAALSAYDSYQAYQEGGASALAKTLMVETAMVATGAGKLGIKASKALSKASDKAENVTKSVATQFEKKIEKQMGKRGWDKDSIDSTIDNPNKTVSTRDTRWNSDGTRRDDPATAYISDAGHYVVRNNNDGRIVQISNRNEADWKSPFE